MGHTVAVIFEGLERFAHQLIDPAPERVFHFMSGLVLIAVWLRLRRVFE